jgi:hypothetical protein
MGQYAQDGGNTRHLSIHQQGKASTAAAAACPSSLNKQIAAIITTTKPRQQTRSLSTHEHVPSKRVCRPHSEATPTNGTADHNDNTHTPPTTGPARAMRRSAIRRTAQTSKKEIRAGENSDAIGGVRSPHHSACRLPQSYHAGKLVNTILTNTIHDNPQLCHPVLTVLSGGHLLEDFVSTSYHTTTKGQNHQTMGSSHTPSLPGPTTPLVQRLDRGIR